jgi:hypothetical protein
LFFLVKGRMISFMSEVYFEAERISDSVEFQASLWDIFGHILAALEMYATLEPELRKDPGYHYFVFSAVLPFFLVFFSAHYDHAKAELAHQKVVSRLAKVLVAWLELDLVDVVCGKQVCVVLSEILRHLGLSAGVAAGAGASLGGANNAAIRSFASSPMLQQKDRAAGGLRPGHLTRVGSLAVGPSSKSTELELERMSRSVEHWRNSHEVASSTNLSQSSKADSKDEGIHGEMRKFARELKQGMDLPQEMQQLAGILRTQMETEITGIIISILSSKISVTEGQTMVLLGLRGMRLIMESNSFGGSDRAALQIRFNELK